jgi:protein-disulfide isomerase
VSKRGRSQQPSRVVREHLAKERRRRRTLWTTLIAVAVLVIAGLIGWSVYQSQKPTSNATPANTTADGAGLVMAGSGPVTVEVYLDFICPFCKQFEASAGPMLDDLAAQNKIKLVWHTLGFLDEHSTTNYSTRAASSAGCASDGGKQQAYGEALFANQPAEGGPGLSDDQLIEIGGRAGLNSPEFAACVRDQKYKGWVAHVNDLAAQRGVNSTPTVYVNGKLIPQPTAESVKAAIDAAG